MALFLSPYVGAGTKADPFRPQGLDEPGASAVDIRLDPTTVDGGGIGWALLWVPSGIPDPSGAIKLADDYGDLLTNPLRNQLNTRLGLDFGPDATIQDAVETIMLRADTLRWKRIRPTRGRIEVWLGSGGGKRLWVNLPVLAGGAILDDFNRADETPIAAPWTAQASSPGTMNLSSNAVVGAGASDAFYYYARAGGWNVDHSSEFVYAASVILGDWAPAIRAESDGLSCYTFEQLTSQRSIGKFVAGSFSVVENVSGTASVGVAYRISAAGSTIRYYEDGVEHAGSPATDTSLSTAGSGPGIVLYQSGGGFDNFIGAGFQSPMFRGT